jgi:hypothetical protein
MGLFNKSDGPLSDRERALNAEIAALEARIKRLEARERPREHPSSAPVVPMADHKNEPIFESVDHQTLQSAPPMLRARFNDLGVRKYDLPALLERIKNHFSPTPASNPKLVEYLAAGSVQGLKTLRYEKRVSRNRFILILVILIAVVLVIVARLIHR